MQRPAGVTILAVLSFFAAFLLFFGGLLSFAGGAMAYLILSSFPSMLVGIGATAVAIWSLALGALYAINGFGLLKVAEWARLLSLVLVGLAVLFAALGGLSALLHFRIFLLLRQLLILTIDLFILRYLVSPEIRRVFRAPGTA